MADDLDHRSPVANLSKNVLDITEPLKVPTIIREIDMNNDLQRTGARDGWIITIGRSNRASSQ